MNDHFPPRPHEPSGIDGDYRPAAADQSAPTEWFPAVQFPAEPFTAAQSHTEPSHTAQFPTANLPGQQFPTEQFPTERLPTPLAAHPVEPLAHEGGLAYGNLPAVPYREPAEFIPQHLAMPPFGPGPFFAGTHPQHFMPHPYPQMQQTVFVTNGSGKRVNHVLHLILTVLSFGLWLPVWAVLAIANS